jgi:hypothetical protein
MRTETHVVDLAEVERDIRRKAQTADWEGEAAVARLLYREADCLKERLAAGELVYVKF